MPDETTIGGVVPAPVSEEGSVVEGEAVPAVAGSDSEPLSNPGKDGAVADAPIPVVEEAVVEDPEEVVAPQEPRLRFRGHLVIHEGERTVGNQTFKHIQIDDGSEYDFDDAEYASSVKISYPPVA